MNTKISVIVPAYNIENYLARTLDSILAQTYTNIEIVVVNDGSKDGTAAIIDRYAVRDSRVKAIHKENGGVTSARLRGVAEATGEWIGFVDGDDDIAPDMYAKLMENAMAYGADISHCGYQMVFPSGKIDYYYNTGRIVEQDNTKGLWDLIEELLRDNFTIYQIENLTIVFSPIENLLQMRYQIQRHINLRATLNLNHCFIHIGIIINKMC